DLPLEAATAITGAYTTAFRRAMLWCALIAMGGGVVSALVIRNPTRETASTYGASGPSARKRGRGD
ncbi:MAG: hypothetical protein M3008_13205, partial [Chloroflexota bacterium]|nr:hypothetical protein [Chloroflexota bacterium]